METYDFLGKDHFFDHEFETSTGSSSPTYSSTETSSASGMESDSGSGAGSPATFLDPRGLDPWDEDPLPAGHAYSMAGTIGSAADGDSGGLEVADPIYWAPQQMAPQVDARQSPPHRGYMPEMQGPPPPVITTFDTGSSTAGVNRSSPSRSMKVRSAALPPVPGPGRVTR